MRLCVCCLMLLGLFAGSPLALGAGGVVGGIKADEIVAADGSGDFKTVQEALAKVPRDGTAPFVIYIKPGTYKEKILVDPSMTCIHLIGQDAKSTILTFDDYAKRKGPDGKPLGTFATGSTTVHARDFEADNITFENSAGPRSHVGQAVALMTDADRCVLRDCRFLGNQDTLYANGGRQYYDHCFIQGDVDFIFGNAAAVFDHCQILSTGKGYVTAQSRTSADQTSGYVLSDCSLTAADSVPDGSVYLGRPWRPYSRVVYLHCQLGPQIEPAGWLNWHDTDNDKTAYYAEYQDTGPGAAPDKRVAWSHQLSAEEAAQFEPHKFLAGADGWNPFHESTTRP